MNKIALQCLYKELPELVNEGILTKEAADELSQANNGKTTKVIF